MAKAKELKLQWVDNNYTREYFQCAQHSEGKAVANCEVQVDWAWTGKTPTSKLIPAEGQCGYAATFKSGTIRETVRGNSKTVTGAKDAVSKLAGEFCNRYA